MKSWRTTLAGAILGALPVFWEAYHHLSIGDPVNWFVVWFGASLAVLGALAKDANVTGGKR